MSENLLLENWVWTRLGDLCLPIEDADFPRRASSNFQYIDISSIDREQKSITSTEQIDNINAPSRARQVVAKKDVLVSTVRPGLNAVAVVPEYLDNEVCSTGFCVLRANPGVLDFEYLFAWARSSMFVQNLTRMERGIGYPAVSNNDVENMLIPLPPLPEQRRIATILCEADEIRKLRRQASEKAQEIVSALFYDMFGDPATNPKVWRTEKLSNLVIFTTSGPRNWAMYYTPQGAKFIRVQNLTNHKLNFDNMVFISPPDTIEARRSRVEPNDILFSITGVVGLVAVAPEDIGEAYVSQHVAIVRLKPGVDANFVAAFLAHEAGGQSQIGIQQYGQTKPGFGLNDIRSIKVFLPPLSLQKQFSIAAAEIDVMNSKQVENFLRLDIFYQSLLARAFTGELTGTWREQHAQELAQAARERDHLLTQLRLIPAEPVMPAQPVRIEISARGELLAVLNDIQKALFAMFDENPAIYYTAGSAHEELVTIECSLDVVQRELHFLAAVGWIKEQTLPAESELDSVRYVPVYRSLLTDDNSQQPDIEQLIARLGSEYPDEVLV